MKKVVLAFVLSVFSVGVFAQDWQPVGMNFTGISQKKVAVNDQGVVALFMKDNAGGEGYFWLYDPFTLTWSEVTGNFNASNVEDLNLITDGEDFFISYNQSSLQTEVYKVSSTGSVSDYSFGLANGVFSLGISDLFLDRSTNGMYMLGLNGDQTDINLMEWTGANWDTVALDVLSSAGTGVNTISDFEGYVNDQDLYIFAAFNDGANAVGLFQTQIGTWSFGFANGLGGPNYSVNPTKVSIDGDGTGFPAMACNNLNVMDSVYYFEYDGGGMSVNSGLATGNNVLNIDLAVEGGEKMLLVSTDAPANSSNVYRWNGSMMENAHPSMAGIGQIDDAMTSLAMNHVNRKPYVIVEKQTDFIQVYALNHTPSVSNAVLGSTCAGSYSYIIDPLDIQDSDVDSTWAIVTSLSQAIIADLDIYEYYLSKNGQITSYNYEAYGSADGTADISVVITDGIATDTIVYQITVAPPITIDVTTISNLPICSTNGPIDLNSFISPTGGSWSGSAIDQNGMLDPLEAQQDNVVYYDYEDANGCFAYEEITLNTVLGPSISPEPSTAASCGNADGAAEVMVLAGATNDYFIQWSTGDTNTTVVNNLESGQYVVTVIDTNNCENSLNYVVPSSDITVNVNSTNPACQGDATGAIDLTVSGNGPFSYYWINGDTTEDLTNVEAGFYSVTITDNNGCTTEEIVNLQSLSTPMSLDDSWPNDGQCLANDGGVSLNVSGGTSPYTFLWSNAQTSQNLTNVGPGTYSVTVTDDNNCQVTASYTVSTYDGPYIYYESITDASCNQNDGAIDITISTSQNPVQSILWSNSASTEDITGLSAGTYTVVVTDVVGCEGQASFEVEPVKPAVQPICLVTVDSLTTTNLVVWERTTTSNISHYNIYRETGMVGNYPLVGTVSFADESIWNDVSASPLVTSWRYKLTQVDDCGVESNKSSHHKTMHVTISKGLGTNYNVFWDDYEGIQYSTITLWRYDQTNGLQTLATLPSNVYSYTDDPGNDTINLDYFVGFDLAAPCTSSRAQDYNGTRSNRSAGVFDPGDGIDLSIFENDDLSDQILIYPNPNNGEFTIDFGNYLLGEKTIKVLDSRGRIVAYKKAFGTQYDLNMVHVEPGIYFVEVLNGGNRGLKKIIIK